MQSSVSWRMDDAEAPSELVPDHMLPVQFTELLQRGSERTPELRLMAAVLEDAIRTFCRCAGSRGIRSQRLFRETAEWFDSSDASWPFAFDNICDALGLEPDWIRGLLRSWVSTEAAAARRPVKIASVRRIAGSRHTVTGRAPELGHVTRFAS